MGFSPTTFIFELVNFVVLVWLLQRLLYRPLKRGIERRLEAMAERERETAELGAKLDKREAELDQRMAEVSSLREQKLSEAAAQAAAERARLLSQAKEDAAQERQRASHLLDVERQAAHAWVRESAVSKSTEIAGRMLLALAPDAVDQALFEKLLEELTQQDPASLELSLSNGADVEAEVTSAKLLSEVELGRLKQVLAELTGRTPRLVLREDDSLLGGLSVRVGARVFDASVAGQLEVFQARARQLAEQEVNVG